MPDITMCVNTDCPLKMDCYRFQAFPKEYHQSVSRFTPDENGKCDHFVHIEGWTHLRNSPDAAFQLPPKPNQ